MTPASRFAITKVDETDSTNDDLLKAAAAGAADDGAVLVARFQRAGRGRLGRTWQAPPGSNLLVSVLFAAGDGPVHHHVQRVSLAMVAAVRRLDGSSPTLKWPNDLLLDERKLAGVLAQAGSDGSGGLGWVVVGIGVNATWAPDGAARLSRTAPDDLLTAWLEELEPRLGLDPTDEYRANLATLGRSVRVELPAGELLGVALDVTPHGELVVRGPDGDRTLSVGDVTHVRHRTDQPSG